jgi:AcrR family transcriptional regulator
MGDVNRNVAKSDSSAPRRGNRPTPLAPLPSQRLQRVLVEVEALFLAEGFMQWNTTDIAERVKCSKTSLYQLAPTRDGLVQLIVDRYLSDMRMQGRRAAEEAGGWNEAVRAFLDAAVSGLRRSSQAFLRDLSALPTTRERVREHQRQRMSDIEHLLRAGIKAGAFHGFHPRVLSEMLFATIGRLTEPDVMAAIGLSASEAFKEAYAIFEEGIVPSAARRQRISRATRENFGNALRASWTHGIRE